MVHSCNRLGNKNEVGDGHNLLQGSQGGVVEDAVHEGPLRDDLLRQRLLPEEAPQLQLRALRTPPRCGASPEGRTIGGIRGRGSQPQCRARRGCKDIGPSSPQKSFPPPQPQVGAFLSVQPWASGVCGVGEALPISRTHGHVKEISLWVGNEPLPPPAQHQKRWTRIWT